MLSRIGAARPALSDETCSRVSTGAVAVQMHVRERRPRVEVISQALHDPAPALRRAPDVHYVTLPCSLGTVYVLLLRRDLPNIERPYRSPLGNAGAIVAAIIALVSMVSLFFNEDYRPGVVGTALWFAVGLLYFAVGGRNRLVFSPEEEFAVNMREKHGRSAHSAGTPRGRVRPARPPRRPLGRLSGRRGRGTVAGNLELKQLGTMVDDNEIDTVLVVFVDLQGRFMENASPVLSSWRR